MPLTKRQDKRRRVLACRTAIEKSASYLLELRVEYDPDYPDFVTTIDSLLKVHEILINLLVSLRDSI